MTVSLEGIERIPDPASAHRARRETPPAAPPSEPSPTREERKVRTRAMIAGASLWLVGAVAIFGLRHDITSPLVLAPLAAWAITILAGLVVVLRPRKRGLPTEIHAVQHALWSVPMIYVTVALAVSHGSGDPPFAWSTIRGCLGIANLVAAGPLVAAALVLRGTFLSGATWRGAAVGALAGLAGSLGVHAHCPIVSVDHLLAAHGASIVVGAVAGAIFGRMRGSA